MSSDAFLLDSISFRQFCSIVDQVSQTSKQDLLKAFRKIDVNGDGFITHDELFKVLTKVRSTQPAFTCSKLTIEH